MVYILYANDILPVVEDDPEVNQINYWGQVTRLKDGGFVVTWTNYSTRTIEAQRYDALGNKAGSVITVGHDGQRVEDSAVIGLKDGGFMVTWSAYPAEATPYSDRIMGRRFDADGEAVGDEFVVSADLADQAKPSITELANGDVIITWAKIDDDGTTELWFQRFSSSGALIGDAARLDPGRSTGVNGVYDGWAVGPQITALSGGGFVATYAVVYWGEFRVVTRTFDATGAATGQAFGPDDYWFKESLPEVTALADGGYVVAWRATTQSNTDGYFAIYAQRIAADGSLIGGQLEIRPPAMSLVYEVKMASATDGSFFVVWHSFDGETDTILAQRFDASGQKLGVPLTVATGYVSGADVIALDDGAFVVTWSGRDGDETLLYQRRFSTQGSAGQDMLITGDDNAENLTSDSGDDQILAAGGNDTVAAMAGDDMVDGGDGDDVIDGGDGDDQLKGKLGKDWLKGGAGVDILVDGLSTTDADTLEGGAGDDLLTSFGGGDLIDGGDGFDSAIVMVDGTTFGLNIQAAQVSTATGLQLADGTIIRNIEEAAFQSGSGNDTFSGSTGSDLVLSGAGDDTLLGGGGDDALNGQDGRDTVDGGAGDDDLAGGFGDDDMSGGDGHDTVVGDLLSDWGEYNDGGNDNLAGGEGNDLVYGISGHDTLVGEGGDDTLYGGSGNDVLDGGAGNDSVYMQGRDTALGGAGDDTIGVGSYPDLMTVDGGEGIDLLSFYSDDLSAFTLTSIEALDIQSNNFAATTALYNSLVSIKMRIDDFWSYLRISDSGAVDFSTKLTTAVRVTGSNAGNTITGTALGDTISGGEGNDLVFGGDGDDVLYGGGGDDTLYGAAGNDRLSVSIGTSGYGGAGNDTYSVGFASAPHAGIIDGGDGIDTVKTSSSIGDWTIVNVERLEIDRYDFTASSSVYNAFQSIRVYYDLRFSDAGAVDFTSKLSAGTIIYASGVGSDIVASAYNDTINGGDGVDRLNGGAGDDLFYIGSGSTPQDSIYGGSGRDAILTDTLDGLAVMDSVEVLRFYNSYYSHFSITVENFSKFETIEHAYGSSNYHLKLSNSGLIDFGTRLTDGIGVFASDFGNTIIGNASGNYMVGGAGNDTLRGGAGDDSFFSGKDGGADLIDGGDGIDTFTVPRSVYGDSPQSLGQHTFTHVERLTIESTDVFTASVEQLNSFETITRVSDAAYFRLSGAGAINFGDKLSSRVSVFGSGVGNTITATAFGDHVSGGAGHDTLNGVAGSDHLQGNDGDDLIDGGLGNDTLAGGAGIDMLTYVSASAAITISLNIAATAQATGGSGLDIVSGFENLTGSAFSDKLTGNGSGNLIVGGLGNDTMEGLAGDDTYHVDAAGDMIAEKVNAGNDLVFSSVSYILADYVEALTLVGDHDIDASGNGAANALTGNGGRNVLNGGAGADTLIGGLGHDTYVVDNAGDLVVEAVSGGTDMVLASISQVLAANVENLTLTGGAHITGTGNGLNNTLTGNSGNNVLDGGAGGDRMVGGLGDDTYFVDNTADSVGENHFEGTDTIISSVSYSLNGRAVEVLTLTGAAQLTGVGNSLNNVMTGNAGNNTLEGAAGNDALDGGTGADRLLGGLGDDTYYVDNAGDSVGENHFEGTDTIISSVSYSLVGRAVEVLALTGAGNLNSTGNSLNNTLTGNSGNNVLDGGAGGDRMVGGLGNDTYYVDNIADSVGENHFEGTDTIISSVSYSLNGRAVEVLTLTGAAQLTGLGNSLNNVMTGNAGNNTLEGASGNDVLDGGVGADRLLGGLGDDTYYVDNSGDSVGENHREGTDTIISSVSYSLVGRAVEVLALNGAGNLNGTGNSLNNTLTGNSGNNVLDGGAGGDRMLGGLGNDTYFVDNAADSVGENHLEGTDTIISSVSYSLNGRAVEVLTLTGSANIDGTGNSLANTISGNSGGNRLNGGGGNDILAGGLGADVFVFLAGNGKDTVIDFSAAQNDTLNINAYTSGVANSAILTQAGSNVVIDLGGGNIVTVLNAVTADVLSHIAW